MSDVNWALSPYFQRMKARALEDESGGKPAHVTQTRRHRDDGTIILRMQNHAIRLFLTCIQSPNSTQPETTHFWWANECLNAVPYLKHISGNNRWQFSKSRQILAPLHSNIQTQVIRQQLEMVQSTENHTILVIVRFNLKTPVATYISLGKFMIKTVRVNRIFGTVRPSTTQDGNRNQDAAFNTWNFRACDELSCAADRQVCVHVYTGMPVPDT